MEILAFTLTPRMPFFYRDFVRKYLKRLVGREITDDQGYNPVVAGERNKKLLNLIDNLIGTGPSQADFDAVMEQMLDVYDSLQYSDGQWCGVLQNFHFYGYDEYSNYRERIKSITREDIHRVLKTILTSGNHIDVSIVE